MDTTVTTTLVRAQRKERVDFNMKDCVAWDGRRWALLVYDDLDLREIRARLLLWSALRFGEWLGERSHGTLVGLVVTAGPREWRDGWRWRCCYREHEGGCDLGLEREGSGFDSRFTKLRGYEVIQRGLLPH